MSLKNISGLSQNLVADVQVTDRIGKETAAQAQTVSATLEEHNATLAQVNQASQSLAQLAQTLQIEISRFRLRWSTSQIPSPNINVKVV